MPFVTETLWQRLPADGPDGARDTRSLMVAAWPDATEWGAWQDDEAEAQVSAS